MASVNLAFARVKAERGEAVWRELFVEDHFHPSPLGTALAACVVLAVIRAVLRATTATATATATATTVPTQPPPLPSLPPPFQMEEPPPAEQLFSRARTMMAEGQTGRLPTPEELRYFWQVAEDLTGD